MRLKHHRFKLILDDYQFNTVAGEWITPLNPDNINFEFIDMGLHGTVKISGRKTIYINNRYEVRNLFPYIIKALWELKQKREAPYCYFLFKLFNPSKIDKPASEKAEIAYNWLRNRR